jgi:hypothetical protein
MEPIIDRLAHSEEPSIRLRALILGQTATSEAIRQAQQEVRDSPRVQALLSERDADGRIPLHPYSKWRGAHWVLAALADIGYPPGDESLIPLREQVCTWLLSERHTKSIRVLDGRVRRHASQEGNALYPMLTLGLAESGDGRRYADELAARLMRWQWPDGGWNCDKKPEAIHSSFMESLIPLRALALYARQHGDLEARQAAEGAAEIFVKRRMFKRQRDGSVIAEDFVKLHYPCYWHYDILFGLKVITEAGLIADPRCADALDLLESKRLPDGGFPAEGKYYVTRDTARTGRSTVDWGVVRARQMNEFVTVDALTVLQAAGRWKD